MAYYLSMNGTSDKLQLPTMSATKVIIDCYIDSTQDNSRDVLLDTRTGSTFFMDIGFMNMRFKIDGGVEKTSNVDIPKDSRHTLEIYANSGATTVMTDNFMIFAKNDGLTQLKGKIYSISVYNLTTLIASYDMNTQTVQDQSGNGNHATLTGGTWVSDATGTTHNGAASITGVSTITASATVIPAAITGSASLQGVATVSATADVVNAPMVGSASLQGVGTATATASVIRSGSANIIGVSTLTASAAGLAVLGGASLTGVGWVMCSAIEGQFIVSVVNLEFEVLRTVQLESSIERVVNLEALLTRIVALEGEL